MSHKSDAVTSYPHFITGPDFLRAVSRAFDPAPLPLPRPVEVCAPLPVPGREKILNGSQAKTAFALRMNAETMIQAAGLECVGFLTLTVGDWDGERFNQVFDSAEASRRLNNLNRRILSDLFERAIIVTERHKSGAIHFHMLGVIKNRPDIRTGFDFGAVAKRDYRSVREDLRGLWAMLREKLPAYGFGRAELTPIKKCGKAVAAYVSKYIEKNVKNRPVADKGKKLVRYLGWDRAQLKPNGFSWATERARAWRAKARAMAGLIGIEQREDCAEALGPRWANTLTSLWVSGIGDDVNPGFSWDWRQKEVFRAELFNLCSAWAKQKDAERLRFSEEVKLFRVEWPENQPTQLRQRINYPAWMNNSGVEKCKNIGVLN